MKILTGIIVLLPASSALAQGPHLANDKLIFPAGSEALGKPARLNLWDLRLSPDGKRLLYSRPKGDAGQSGANGPSDKYDLVLRDLAAGKDLVLPISPMDSGWRSVHTRFDPFDPAGKQLALNEISADQRPEETCLYDVVSGKPVGEERDFRFRRAQSSGTEPQRGD